MNSSNQQLRALVDDWLGRVSPTNIVVLLYIYSKAMDCADGRVSQSIEEIAAATRLSWGTVRIKLNELANLNAIEILSDRRKRTLIQTPERYWLQASQTSTADDQIKQRPQS
jgi:hypothetical protein